MSTKGSNKRLKQGSRSSAGACPSPTESDNSRRAEPRTAAHCLTHTVRLLLYHTVQPKEKRTESTRLARPKLDRKSGLLRVWDQNWSSPRCTHASRPLWLARCRHLHTEYCLDPKSQINFGPKQRRVWKFHFPFLCTAALPCCDSEKKTVNDKSPIFNCFKHWMSTKTSSKLSPFSLCSLQRMSSKYFYLISPKGYADKLKSQRCEGRKRNERQHSFKGKSFRKTAIIVRTVSSECFPRRFAKIHSSFLMFLWVFLLHTFTLETKMCVKRSRHLS